mmetsp:Transcript_8728/g.25158  ORF Transcript_8728/g.25158 Transcript_8728/m.25158 type:complete len:627 (-) Transcript_8728:126-2006(-)
MPRADRSLCVAIAHERFAGSDWIRVRAIAADLLQALDHLHSRGVIHGDLKPQNAMRVGETWQLIDLDVSCELGAPFGSKPPSSGCCPPEMARVLLDTGGDSGRLREYRAAVAYDLWSFGTVLYNLACAVSLWNTDVNDDVLQDDLRLLAAWDKGALNRKLALGGVDQKHSVLATLLAKLLDPDPAVRESHWPEGIAARSILQDEFFRESKELGGVKIDRMLSNQERMLRMQNRMQNQLDSVLGHLQAQARMLSTLIKGDRQVPSLVCFLPVIGQSEDGRRWWQGAARPSQWMNREVDLFFVEPVGLMWVQGHSFRLKFQREWVTKAMPYIRVGLTVLKTASAASRLAGFPIPNLAGEAEKLIGEQLEMLGSLREEAVDALCGAMGADRKSVGEMMAPVDEHVRGAAASSLKEAAAQFTAPVSDPSPAVGKGLHKSAAELARWLDSEHAGWRERTGLQLAVCQAEGSSEWVLAEDVEEFERQGSKLLGSRTHKQEENASPTPPSTLVTEGPAVAEAAQGPAETPADSSNGTTEPLVARAAAVLARGEGAAASEPVVRDSEVSSQLSKMRRQHREDMERVQQQLEQVHRNLQEVQRELQSGGKDNTGERNGVRSWNRRRASATNCCIC